MIAIKYGGAMVSLPLVNTTLRNDVRRNYRDWRRTHDRYDARAHATAVQRCIDADWFGR